MPGIQNFSYVSGLIHRATVPAAVRGARTYYRVGSMDAGWTNETSFLAHPGVGPDVPVNILVRWARVATRTWRATRVRSRAVHAYHDVCTTCVYRPLPLRAGHG